MKKAGLRHCPAQCPNETKKIDIYRTKYCDYCPRTRQMLTFEQSTKERWEQWLGDEADGFEFKSMLSTLYQIISLEEMPDDKISVKSSIFRNVYRAEKRRIEEQK